MSHLSEELNIWPDYTDSAIESIDSAIDKLDNPGMDGAELTSILLLLSYGFEQIQKLAIICLEHSLNMPEKTNPKKIGHDLVAGNQKSLELISLILEAPPEYSDINPGMVDFLKVSVNWYEATPFVVEMLEILTKWQKDPSGRYANLNSLHKTDKPPEVYSDTKNDWGKFLEDNVLAQLKDHYGKEEVITYVISKKIQNRLLKEIVCNYTRLFARLWSSGLIGQRANSAASHLLWKHLILPKGIRRPFNITPKVLLV